METVYVLCWYADSNSLVLAVVSFKPNRCKISNNWRKSVTDSKCFLGHKFRYWTEASQEASNHECLKDPITWLFTGFGFTLMLHDNVSF